ncbi:MAG TPA: hypothetical protein VIF12_06090 [Micavibrio sp.]|jgi:hypothetical protein
MAINPLTGGLDNRREEIFDVPVLKLFFITGQSSQLTEGFRQPIAADTPEIIKSIFSTATIGVLCEGKTGIICKPYHTLSETDHDDLKTRSSPLDNSHVDIHVDEYARVLELHDKITKSISTCAFDRLDPDVCEGLNELASKKIELANSGKLGYMNP